MIRAYFFDMDGTLMDSEILWVEAVQAMVQDWGYPMSHEEALAVAYGTCWPGIYEEIRKRYPAVHLSDEALGAAVQPYFEKLLESRDVRIASSVELLKRLSETYPVAIVSGSYRYDIAACVEIMGVASHISFFLGHEDYHPGKPHPACYQLAAQRLELSPAQCLVFEDSTVGITAAKAAGMRCIALARPDRPRQDVSQADSVLEDLACFNVAKHETESGKGF